MKYLDYLKPTLYDTTEYRSQQFGWLGQYGVLFPTPCTLNQFKADLGSGGIRS